MVKHSQSFHTLKIFTTSIAIWWGVVLILPFDTFSTAVPYRAMAEIASEFYWGLLMLLMGCSHLIGITYSLKKIERASFLIATFVWIFIAAMFAFGSPPNTASGTYAIIGLLTGWLYTKVKVGENTHGR
ncbi:hypothetical protein ACPA0F_18555 [Solibacillus silvestris]